MTIKTIVQKIMNKWWKLRLILKRSYIKFSVLELNRTFLYFRKCREKNSTSQMLKGNEKTRTLYIYISIIYEFLYSKRFAYILSVLISVAVNNNKSLFLIVNLLDELHLK